MLASKSTSACMAVAEAKIEPQLAKLLSKTSDPTTQCWTMSILSNCAMSKGSRERQAVAVPALCSMLTSSVPEVQHAAALHLATLSHSEGLTMAIGSNNRSMSVLHALESKRSATLAPPAYRSLRDEASQYARWALRTAQGRHYKPAYVPKSAEQLEAEAATAITARVKSSFVANQYRNEMKARRTAATIVQASYRGHTGRQGVAAQLMVEGPAAALLQGVMRGRRQRKQMAAEVESKAMDSAATRMQAAQRGRNARLRKRRAAAAATAAEGGTEDMSATDGTLGISLACSDGMLDLPLDYDTFSGVLPIPIACSDGEMHLELHLTTQEDIEEVIDPVYVFLRCADGEVRLRLEPQL